MGFQGEGPWRASIQARWTPPTPAPPVIPPALRTPWTQPPPHTADRPDPPAATRRGGAALVSGDRKHFGSAYGQQIGGVTIHSPRSLAEAVLG